jgi:hypothetical protein
MEILIILSTLVIIITIQIIVGIISKKRYVGIFNDNLVNELKKYNYNNFEIRRKRRPLRLKGSNYPAFFIECPLEYEYTIPWSTNPPEDIIEIYGIENNKKYLIYRMDWSKNDAIEVKNIVNKLN